MTADTPRDAAASPLPPVFQPLLPDDPREVGGYRLFARLGAGGMGRVYLSYTPGGRRWRSRWSARSSPRTASSAAGSPRRSPTPSASTASTPPR